MDLARVTIRPFELSDADDFFRWASDDTVNRFLRWATLTSREEAYNYLRDVAIPHPFRQSICLDNRSVGYVSVTPNTEFRAHISYAVAKEFRGQGICTAAVKMTITMVFQKFPSLVRIDGQVEVGNLTSLKVLEKVGFVKEGLLRKYTFHKGELRDMFMYSFLSTDKFN